MTTSTHDFDHKAKIVVINDFYVTTISLKKESAFKLFTKHNNLRAGTYWSPNCSFPRRPMTYLNVCVQLFSSNVWCIGASDGDKAAVNREIEFYPYFGVGVCCCYSFGRKVLPGFATVELSLPKGESVPLKLVATV